MAKSKKEKAQEIEFALQGLKRDIFKIHELNKTANDDINLPSIETFYSEINDLAINIFN